MQLSKFCLVFILSVLSFTTVFSQNNLSEGYYVGLKKDTIHGFFNLEDLETNKIVFYADKTTSSSKKLSPDDISQIETLDSVSIRSFVYTYKDLKEALFITKFADGNVSLYKGYSSNPDEKEVFLINSIKNSLIRKISKNNPKEFLNTYFKGCELGTNFSVKYAQNSLLSTITEISKCAFPNAKIEEIVRKRRKIEVELGVKAAFFVNKSKPERIFGDRASNVSARPLLGIILGIHFSSKIKLHTGLNVFTRQMTNTGPKELYCSPILGCYSVLPYSLATTFVEIPVAVHYEFNTNRPTYIPKLILGGSFLNPIRSSLDDANKAKITEILYNTGTANASFFIGGGVKKVLKNKSSIELCLKYASEIENPARLAVINSKRLELSFNYLFSLSKNK